VTIPIRFQQRILTHAIAATVLPTYPLAMFVQGSPGIGKTYQLEHVLRTAGVSVFTCSGAQLSGNVEGAAHRVLRDVYAKASEHVVLSDDNGMAAIVIEDLDMSVAGPRDDTRTTVNTQLLIGFMMNLFEDPRIVNIDPCRRVPVFATGNDFSNFHAPLVRPGRVDFFTWEPEPNELLEIYGSILREYAVVSDRDIRDISEQADLTPALLRAALNRCVADNMYAHVIEVHTISINDIRKRLGTKALWPNVNQIRTALDASAQREPRSRSFLRGRA
jgi:ATP-dependent 26S proteasome regulatory subunit